MMPVLIVAVAAGIALPHVLRLQRATPSTAAVIWTAALTLRALSVTLAAAWLLMFFPGTHLFGVLTQWCWHHLLSFALNGHDVGHATTFIPMMFGLASLASVVWASVNLARALRRLVHGSLDGGPAGSVIVGGPDVVLGVVGLRRPRVLISAGALLELDDDELAAALAHERAHIARRHRYILVYAELCGALGRLLLGTRAAIEELSFQLERDADHWAIARVTDRRALATALKKASRTRLIDQGFVLALGGRGVDERVEELLREPVGAGRERSAVPRLLAATLVSLVLVLAVSVPPVFAAGWGVVSRAPVAVHCND